MTIVLSGDTDDPRAEWVLHWHTSDDHRQFAKLGGLIGPEVDAYVAEQWEESLPHEIGHVLVWQHLSTHWTPPIPDEYATPLVDWFEEAVAIWMEPPHLRNQRLAIARALMNDPEILLVDEPTAHLDTALSRELIALFLELKEEGKTFVIASHDPLVLNGDLPERIVHLRDGTVSQEV